MRVLSSMIGLRSCAASPRAIGLRMIFDASNDEVVVSMPQDSSVDVVASGEAIAPWRAYLRAMGPGLVTGASDDDPSGIATYSQTGAKFGFSMLWV